MSKTLKFSPEVDDFIHELLARAIQRAIDNGTYVYIPAPDEEEQQEENLQIAK